MATGVKLLQLSPTMTEGTVVKWLKKVGDTVKSGEPIAEIETDKAVMEQESFDDGVVLQLVVPEGQKVAVESLIAVIGAKGEDPSTVTGGAAAKPAAKTAAPAPAPAAAPAAAPAPAPAAPAPAPAPVAAAPAAPAAPKPGERVIASPLARKMAADAGIDLSTVVGSGPGGRIVKSDIETILAGGAPRQHAMLPVAPTATSVLAAAVAAQGGPEAIEAALVAANAASTPGAPAAKGDVETLRVSGMRATIARRLVESKVTVPHFQVSIDVRGEKLLEAVAKVRAKVDDPKVTVSHFLIKAMGSVIMRHRAMRSQWAGDTIRVINAAHISVAVAIEDGLMTPVLRNVQSKGVLEIARELKYLAGRAKERKLTAEDLTGGVQTLSNLGMYGIDQFNAIVNPPEASILAAAAMQDKPVVENGQVVAGKVMTLTISADHRVVDGAVAAAYLVDLKAALEEPLMMLL
jgi:pyruvate dehydrogenase E2 component (dihydrolipoamide acetyltransferase)